MSKSQKSKTSKKSKKSEAAQSVTSQLDLATGTKVEDLTPEQWEILIRFHWADAKYVQRMSLRVLAQSSAYYARFIGYRSEKGALDEKVRHQIFSYGMTVLRKLWSDKLDLDNLPDSLPADPDKNVSKETAATALLASLDLLLMSGTAYKMMDQSFEKCKHGLEHDMRGAPPQVLEAIDQMVGVGPYQVAKIIGEAGCFDRYATPFKLYKYMGIGFVDGRRQGDPKNRKDNKEWVRHGYVGRRRSISYTMSDTVIMQARIAIKRGKFDLDAPQMKYLRIFNKYFAYYKERVEYTKDLPGMIGDRPNPDKWAGSRPKLAAMRVVGREIVLDLWKAWTGKEWYGTDKPWSAETHVLRPNSDIYGGPIKLMDVLSADAEDEDEDELVETFEDHRRTFEEAEAEEELELAMADL